MFLSVVAVLCDVEDEYTEYLENEVGVGGGYIWTPTKFLMFK